MLASTVLHTATSQRSLCTYLISFSSGQTKDCETFSKFCPRYDENVLKPFGEWAKKVCGKSIVLFSSDAFDS